MAATMRRLQACRRSLTVCQIRCSSLASAEVANVSNEENKSLYPPIKPKYPPGRWGGMSPGYAWLWHQSAEESLAIADPRDRIAALCEKEMIQLAVKTTDTRPRVLDFKKYVTKTRVLPGLPDVYRTSLDADQLDDLTATLSPHVCDLIVMETDPKLRRGVLRRTRPAGDGHAFVTANLLTRSILNLLTTHMSVHFPHLLTVQSDQDVSIAAMWDRHGFERSRRRMVHPDKYKYETVNDQRVKAGARVSFVLRADKPLPEFVGREEAPSVGENFPELKFSPIVFGQPMPAKGKGKVEAGHVWGDPCEFGLLGVFNTVWSRWAARRFGPDLAEEARLAQGLMGSFVWLAAQAHHQGFNTLVDTTYPLTTQTVLTDGQRWQFLAYQLNTLRLWTDDDGNPMANLCWAAPESQLFAGVENGRIEGFNPDVLRQLIAMLALTPALRPYDLRPTLPSAVDPKDRQEFIPSRKEVEVVVEEEKYVV